MIKLEFWKKLHSKWVSDTDGVPSHIKAAAAKVDGKTAAEIDKEVDNFDDDDFKDF